MIKLRAATGANGTNLVQESGPVAVSIEQVLMGKKRKQWLVPEGFGAQLVCFKMLPEAETRQRAG